jgi:hypothetical protein
VAGVMSDTSLAKPAPQRIGDDLFVVEGGEGYFVALVDGAVGLDVEEGVGVVLTFPVKSLIHQIKRVSADHALSIIYAY